MATDHLLQELSEQECRRLLGTAALGRIAVTERALPMIVPVHYTVRGDDVVLSNLSASRTRAAEAGAVLAFEVDEYDPVTRQGWAVSVVGPSRPVCDPAEVAALNALNFAPWVGDVRQGYVAVRIGLLKGRRLLHGSNGHAAPAAVAGAAAAATLAQEA